MTDIGGIPRGNQLGAEDCIVSDDEEWQSEKTGQKLKKRKGPRKFEHRKKKRSKTYHSNSESGSDWSASELSNDVFESRQEDDVLEVMPIATPVESRIGRSCKRAAMNFIKTVCLHGRRPEGKANFVFYIPDPEDPDKVFIVRGTEKEINLLKNSNLNPVVNLGERFVFSEESIAIPVQQYKLSKRKVKSSTESPRKQERKANDKSKIFKTEKGKLKAPNVTKFESTHTLKAEKGEVPKAARERVIPKSPQARLARDTEVKEKKKITYKEKIENLIAKQKLLESLDSELATTNVPSVDSAPGCEVISLSDLRKNRYGFKEKNISEKLHALLNEPQQAEVLKTGDIRLAEIPKQAGGLKQTETGKLVEIPKHAEVPKEGARKMFPPLRPKGVVPQYPQQKVTLLYEKKNARKSTQATVSTKPPADDSSKDRVFVVMPDGSMGEISPAAEQAIVKKTPESLKKEPIKKNDTASASKIAANRRHTALQPSLEDCTTDVIDDAKTLKLPNILQLVESELPLSEAENSNKLTGIFLFRQVVSPNDSGHKCLLCPTKSTWKYVSELEMHYHYVHEITVQHFKAEFSENVVFVCVLQDVTELSTLNSACLFCDSVLKNLSEVRNHYSSQHSKTVRLVQETALTYLSSMFYCSICSHSSSDFLSHHQHMKVSHRMQTYICRYCTFCTAQPNHLKTHVKQRHPQQHQQQSQSVQNGSEEKCFQTNAQKNKLKCPVCLLLMGGKYNLDRHILIAHSVQTGPDTWSCAKCLLSCGPVSELAAHLPKCPRLKADSPVKSSQPTPPTKRVVTIYKCVDCFSCFTSEKEIKDHVSETKHTRNYDILKHLINSPASGGTNICFLCDMKFTSTETYKKHLLHIHMERVESKTAKNFKKTDTGLDTFGPFGNPRSAVHPRTIGDRDMRVPPCSDTGDMRLTSRIDQDMRQAPANNVGDEGMHQPMGDQYFRVMRGPQMMESRPYDPRLRSMASGDALGCPAPVSAPFDQHSPHPFDPRTAHVDRHGPHPFDPRTAHVDRHGPHPFDPRTAHEAKPSVPSVRLKDPRTAALAAMRSQAKKCSTQDFKHIKKVCPQREAAKKGAVTSSPSLTSLPLPSISESMKSTLPPPRSSQLSDMSGRAAVSAEISRPSMPSSRHPQRAHRFDAPGAKEWMSGMKQRGEQWVREELPFLFPESVPEHSFSGAGSFERL